MDDSESLRRGRLGLTWCVSVQTPQYRLDVLLSEMVLYKSRCIALSKSSVKENGLTQSSLCKSFGRQRECGLQLQHNRDHHLVHVACMRDLGINTDVPKKAFDQLEQVGERIVVGFYVLGHLKHTNVTRLRTQEIKKGTYSK